MERRTPQTNIKLNIYDLAQSNAYTAAFGIGFFHTGVEFAGDEYSFGSGAGVFVCPPRQATGAVFRESLDMGNFQGTYNQAKEIALSLRSEFQGNTYNLLTKNCNTYSNALCELLVHRTIPNYINRAAYLGSFCSCLIPQDNELENAPVTGSVGRAQIIDRGQGYSPFKGTGYKLSSSSVPTPSSSSTESSTDGLIQRREKLREAALKRLEKKN